MSFHYKFHFSSENNPCHLWINWAFLSDASDLSSRGEPIINPSSLGHSAMEQENISHQPGNPEMSLEQWVLKWWTFVPVSNLKIPLSSNKAKGVNINSAQYSLVF